MKKGLFVKPVKFNSFNRVKAVSIIFVFLMILSLSSARVFAAETDKDFTLDDGTVDSPQVILRDETDDGELTIQKKDAGEADIINTEGPINLKPSNNVADYIYFFTGTELTGIYFKRDALSYTNWPAVRINATGQLEYRDQDSDTWVTFDSMGGAATKFGDLADVDLSGLAQGDIVYYDGTDWVRLAAGTASQVLTSDGAGNLSWTSISGTIGDGSAANNTLRWDEDGSAWVESAVLTNDGTNVTVAGDLLPGSDATYNLGSATNRWKELHLTGSTIKLGDIEISEHTTASGHDHLHITGSAPLTLQEGICFLSSADTEEMHMQHMGAADLSEHGLPAVLADSFLFLTEEVDNECNMEVVFWDGDRGRPALILTQNQGGTGRVSTFDRSVQVGKALGAAPVNTTYTLFEGFKLVDGHTSITGADIGVEDDIEAKGSIYTQEDFIAEGRLRLADSDASNYVAFQSPATVTTDVTWTLPGADGTVDQVLSTDGSGTLSWADVSAVGAGDITAVGDVASGAAFDGTQGNALQFEGITADDFEVTLEGADPGSDVTLTLPAATDTLVGRATTDTLTNKTLTSPTIQTSPTAAGATWADLGTVTTADINGGTIDGTTIGAATPAAATVTTVTATTGAIIEDPGAGTETVTLQSPDPLVASYSLTLPVDDGTADQVLTTDGAGALSWATAATTNIYSGDGTLAGARTMTMDGNSLTMDGTGDIVFADSGDITTAGDVAVNGGDLTTTATTANLLNTTATTVNIAGASTATSIGAGTGTTTIGNDLAVTNNAAITGDATVTGGDVTIGAGDVAKAGTIVLHDANAGGSFTTTLASNADVGASFTLTLPADDGTANQVLTTDGSGALSWATAVTTNIYSGDGTLAGARTMTMDSNSLTMDGTGDIVFADSGDITTAGDVAVNGGDLTTTATTANLLNTTATTVNIAGASTATAIGAGTGTTTIGNDLTATGDAAITGADLTLGSGTVAKAGTIVLHDANAGGSFTTTLASNADVGASFTLTLPADDGTANQVLTTDGAGALSWATAVTTNIYSGDGTLAGARTMTMDSSSLTMDGTGDIVFADSGDITTAGDVAVNGGDLTTTATTMNLVNTTATTLNIGGASTATAIGAATGTTTIGNDLTATGDATVTGGDVTIGAGDVAKAGTIILHDADGGDSFTTTLASNADVGASFTLTLPADDGTANQVLSTDGSGALSWTDAAAGDITAVGDVVSGAAFDGTQGNALQFEGITADDFEITLEGADPVSDVTLTLPAATDTLVGRATTDTLTNKTLTSPTIETSPTAAGATWADLGTVTTADINGGTIDGTTIGAATPAAATVTTVTATTSAIIEDPGAGTNTVTLQSPDPLAASYSLTLPVDDGTADQVLTTDGAGALSWATAATTNIYSGDGTLAAARTIATGGNSLTIDGAGDIVFADSGDITTAGDVAVNGGDITTTATTMNLANTTATTLNIGGASTATAIGAATGTTTIGNDLTATGDATVTGGDVTIGSGTVAKAGTIVLHDADAGDSFTTTLASNADVGASFTLTLPADDGDANQVLATDGSGALSWATAATTNIYSGDGTLSAARTITTGGNSLTIDGAGDIVFADSGDITTAGDVAVNGGDITTTATTANLVNDTATAVNIAGASTATAIGAATGTTTVGNDLAVTNNAAITGDATVTGGDVTIGAGDVAKAGTIVLHDANAGGSFTTTLASNADVGASFTLTLPADDGTANQVLTTDGSGALSWATAATTNIYSGDGTLAAARTMTMGGNSLTMDGTGDIVFADSGDISTDGDVAITGGDLTTTAATASLFNTGATTVNIAGAGTTVDIGSASGTTSINDALAVDGNTTLGDAVTDTTTITGAASISSGTGTPLSSTRTSAGLWLSMADGIDTYGLYNQAGTPEGSITADTGSVAIDTTNGNIYIKGDDGDNTTWNQLGTSTSNIYGTDGTLSAARTMTMGGNSLTMDGTGDIVFADSGDISTDGDVAITGGDLTTTAATASLFNTGATTVNIASASTATAIGAATGTTTIGNDLAVTNDASITGDATVTGGDVTVGAGLVAKAGTIVLHDANAATSFTTTLASNADVGASFTLTLPADDGTANQVLATDGAGALSWIEGGGAFSTTSNVTSNAPGTLATDDFVFGSNSLNDDGNTDHDSRMYFDKSKSAFRAGKVAGNQWDTGSVGGSSTAMGWNSTASGMYSTAMGGATIASTSYSTAIGRATTASGGSSTAMGWNSTASGGSSTAMGRGTTASGDYSTAMGYPTTAQAYGSVVLGRYNVITGSTTLWTATDPLFVIGNGADGSNRANAMTVLKNGNVGIGTASPTAKLDVAGTATNGNSLRLRSGDRNNGSDSNQILLSYDNRADYTHAIKTRHNANFDVDNSIDFYVWDQSTDADGATGTKHVMSLNDGNVGIGTASPSTKLEVNGYTMLGSDAPKIKMKKLTGTTGATEGSQVLVAHGLTVSKIISITALVATSATTLVPPAMTANAEFQYDVWVANPSIALKLHATNSGNLLSKPCTIVVTYEE